MIKSFYLQNQRTKRLHNEVVSLSNKYIHTYINPQIQSGDRAITHYYTVHQHHMGSNYKQNQFALLNLSMGDKNSDSVIANTK